MELSGKTIVVFLEQIYNEQEFWYPVYRLREAGAQVLVAATRGGAEYTSKVGLPAKSDMAFDDLDVASADGVVIPGGFAPDYMRRSEKALEFVRQMDQAGKLVAFICHAGWVPASAGILGGRKATSVRSIKDDLIHAGAQWQDSAVVRDRNLISSRTPDDLPDFMRAVLDFYRG